MGANIFGQRFQILTFGESHGSALGVVIDGCPAGVEFDLELLLSDLKKRRPGHLDGTSQRKEVDLPEILSGIFENKTLGTPIAMIVRNVDARSQDYSEIKNQPRKGHADDVWLNKFGHSDYRGGGRSSGRETVARVMAGSVAKMLFKKLHPDTEVIVQASQIGPFKIENGVLSQDVIYGLQQAQSSGESWGGEAKICVKNIPASLGQPIFHKLKADLASALMSIGATCAFELGDGQKSKEQLGTEFHSKKSNQYGGIRGGISDGESIELKLIFKPTSSILEVAKKGRHDPCIVPRAIPVIEAMTSLVLADHALWSRTDRV